MTVSFVIEEMTCEERPESSHEYNYFLDRQLQNKLLAVDEETVLKDTVVKSQNLTNTDGKNSKSGSSVKYDEITGWTPSKIAFRKLEKETKSQNAKEFINPWKDYNNKAKQQIQDNFMFRHYTDYREYMEQYRQEHSCIAAMMSPSNRELNEMRKIAIQNTAPSQIQVRQNTCVQCSNVSSSVQNLLTAALQYTNRKDGANYMTNSINNVVNHNGNNGNVTQKLHQCSKHSHYNDSSSHTYKYKMSPDVTRRPESQRSVEAEKDKPEIAKPSRISSAKVPRSAGKSPTKVTVPQTGTSSSGHLKHQPLQTVTIQTNPTVKENGHLYNGGGLRTLDTLACVATDKQLQKSDRPFKMSVQVLSLSHLMMDTSSTVQGHALSPRPSSQSSTNSQQLRRSKSEQMTKHFNALQGQPLQLWQQEQLIQQQKTNMKQQQPQQQQSEIHQQQQQQYAQEQQEVEEELQVAKQLPWHQEQEEENVHQYSNRTVTCIETPQFDANELPEEKSHSDGDGASIGKLSMICLAAEKVTKPSSPKLEQSATYPVFPTNFTLDDNVSVLNTGGNVWNQNNSEVFPKHNGQKKEFTFHSPFKITPSEMRKTVSNSAVERSGAYSSERLEFPDIRSETKVNFLVTANMHKTDPASTKDESANNSDPYRRSSDSVVEFRNWKAIEMPNFKYVQMKNLRNKYSGYILNRKKSSPARTRSSASTVSLTNSSFKHNQDSEESRTPNPYSSNSKNQFGKKCRSANATTESMRKVADYLLKEKTDILNSLNEGETTDDTADGNAIPKADVADLQEHPNLEGLTWCEKLEILRSVNKRQEKVQNKIPKLRFVKDVPLQVQATSLVKPSATDQLYQQRRIKHLLMQARMKGINQFDWLKESPRYRNSNSSSDNDSLSGDSDLGEHPKHYRGGDKPFGAGMEVSEAEEALLSRYNMPSLVKGGGFKMVPHTLQRSNTTVFQS